MHITKEQENTPRNSGVALRRYRCYSTATMDDLYNAKPYHADVMPLLNLGCGRRFHPDWVNVDLVARPPHVQRCDIRRRLPFPDGHFSAVYHSHVLEHLDARDGERMLRECFRVLAPGGILRIAVPDLERLARTYVTTMEKAKAGDVAAQEAYEWTHLQLYDQMTRERSGGEMAEYFKRDPVPAETFVATCMGGEATDAIAAARARRSSAAGQASTLDAIVRWKRELPDRLRRGIIRVLLGAESADAWTVGRFRQSGETHKRMYDAYGLSQLLLRIGFAEPTVRAASESAIPGWTDFALDAREDGTPFKPDSLFLEARKP